MAEYIDKEKLSELIKDKRTDLEMIGGDEMALKAFDYFIKLIHETPAADVVEVKHGYWKEHFAFGCWHYDCPFCDDGYAVKEKETKPLNYCSNCGAKMDGKDDNTDVKSS